MRSRFYLFLISFLFPLLLKAQVDSIPNVNRLLQLSLEELMDIHVVTASGFLQSPIDAPSTITVITAKQIRERGYEHLEDALRDIPGIDMIHINGYAPTLFYFRGMYGAENLRALLMIDGIVENNILGTNDMAGPAYSLHNAERIEIIWGPVSALYGANAFGGVINIISKKGNEIDGLYAEQGFGSFNTSFQKVYLGIKKNKIEFSAAGTLYNTDGPRFRNRDPNYTGSYVKNAFSFNGLLSYEAKKSNTTVGFRIYRTPMGWGTYSNSPTVYLRLPPQGNANLGILGIVQRDFRGERPGLDNSFLRTSFIQNNWNLTQKLKLFSRLTYRETGIDDDSYIYVTVDGRKMIRALVATYSNRVCGEISANFNISEKQNLVAGIEYNRDNVERGSRASTIDFTTIYLVDGRDTLLNLNSTFLPRVFNIRRNFGSYIQYNLNTSWLGETNFTLGLRYDNNSYWGDALNPRIAVVSHLNKKLTLKLQFGTAFRAPTNLEINQTPSPNFQLKKEKIRTYEANVIYFSSRSVRLQLNGFRNELTDVIVLGQLSGLNLDKNPAEITVDGVEGVMNINIPDKFTGFLNLTFQDSRGRNLVTGVSGKVPGIAKIKGNAGVTINVEDLLSLTVSGNWIGERRSPRTSPYGPVDGYILGNIVFSTGKLFKEKVTATLIIHNIFNKKWLDPGFRTADGLLYSTVLEQPGINGIFKIGVKL